MANSVPRRKAEQRRTPDKYSRHPRKTTAQRGYGARWQATAKGWLAKYPLCVECEKHGSTEQATCVDHIIPHRGDMVLFWDSDNWQSLCKRCHDRKTARGE